MPKNPLVSVIIPAYNAEKYLEEAVRSIIEQTYQDIEVLIIDDCSSDQTLALAYNLAAGDSRIRVIENQQNLGIGGNRDKGIDQAKGKYICWQDADDISMPDRIRSQVEYLESRPQVGIVGGFIKFFDKDGDGSTRRYAEDDESLRSDIFRYNPVAQPASMARAVCYEKVGGYDPSLKVSEDLEMMFRIGEQFEFANLQQVVIKYRQLPTSLTAANLKKMERITRQIRAKYKNSQSYSFTFGDALYNRLQQLAMLLPPKLVMKLFQLVRRDTV